jgi:hypothetical protein
MPVPTRIGVTSAAWRFEGIMRSGKIEQVRKNIPDSQYTKIEKIEI